MLVSLRRYIDLFEAPDAFKVRVRVEGYKDGETADEELPLAFVFEFESGLETNAIASAIRAQIRQVRGYEPAKFRWRRVAS